MPIFFSIVLYLVWFLSLIALKKWFLPLSIPDENRSVVHKMADNIVCRVVNFADSIWRYQFISILLICVMQFVAAELDGQSGGVAMAVMVLLVTAVWLTVS